MNTLKYIILLVAVILAATDFSYSQSYSITPNDTFQTVGFMEDLETLTISQLNITSDSILMKWKKVSQDVPANWEATVCDNHICNTSLVDSGKMNPIIPTESGFLLLHITAHVNYGTAIIRYAVWDMANPSSKDTITFIMTVNEPSAIVETENKNFFTIFPIPTSDLANIQFRDNEAHTISIYNSIGDKVYSAVSTRDSKIATRNIPNGTYTISISRDNKSSFSKKIIIQH